MKRKSSQWNWFAWGKHPGLEDFVWAGTRTELFQRFTKWVDNGFARLKADSAMRSRHCSWRFWTKGAENKVVCGLVRNSSDRHGRNFPLLCIGSGELGGWSSNCSMLPLAFESIWKSFEYAASARIDNNRQLQASLQHIAPPLPDWRAYQQRIHNGTDFSDTSRCEESMEGRNRLMKIDCRLPENLPYDWRFCRRVMARDDNQSPLAVFIGEVDEQVAVAIMSNTLTPADFTWLWALNPVPINS